MDSTPPDTPPAKGGWFTTTHWSVVLAAGHSSAPGAREALETLCRAYWYPLYAYIRRQGHPVEDAQDLNQEFFRRLFERKYLSSADPERGRFRTFLLTSLQRFLISEWRRDHATKRGGAKPAFWDGAEAEARYRAEPVTDLTPEKICEKRWAGLLIARVQSRLREETTQAGNAGAPIVNVAQYRVQSPLYQITWGENNLFEFPTGPDSLITDGYFVMLTPLPRGQHTIHRHAETEDGVHAITWHLTVE